MEKVLRISRFKRAVGAENTAMGTARKTLRSLRKKASALWQTVIRTARSSRQDANEVDRKVNLGGIAEVVFRPMCGAGGVFSFPFRSYRNQLRVIY